MARGKPTRDFEVTFFEALVRERPDYVEALLPLAEAYTRSGLYQKGLETDRRLAAFLPEDAGVRYNLACSLALTGNPAEALSELARAVGLGYRDFAHMRRDPDLKSLRGLPAFEALGKKA